MPLAKDPLGGGTEVDGGTSTTWCSHCYRDGRFVRPDMSLEQMRVLVEQKLREQGVPGFLAKWLTKGTPKLKRWNH
jgi:hypothetical protein